LTAFGFSKDPFFRGRSRVARFFMTQCTKTGKIYTILPQNYRMAVKYTNCQYLIPNGHKIFQPFSNSRLSQIYPNWDFWFENIPSGNPGPQEKSMEKNPWLLAFTIIDIKNKMATTKLDSPNFQYQNGDVTY
jgi:hypothetical protein